MTKLRKISSLQFTDDLISNVPNAAVEDVSSLDAFSLNQLFHSLREALAIQATETGVLVSGRNMLSSQYTALIKENQCLKSLLTKVSNPTSQRVPFSTNLKNSIDRARIGINPTSDSSFWSQPKIFVSAFA